nr:hypothetical protein RVX_0938 [Nitratidesulfovibrio sp. HK-II]
MGHVCLPGLRLDVRREGGCRARAAGGLRRGRKPRGCRVGRERAAGAVTPHRRSGGVCYKPSTGSRSMSIRADNMHGASRSSTAERPLPFVRANGLPDGRTGASMRLRAAWTVNRRARRHRRNFAAPQERP